MQNFDYKIDTQIFFGRGKIDRLGMAVKAVSGSALVIYGGGSVRKNGILEAALFQLDSARVTHTELEAFSPIPGSIWSGKAFTSAATRRSGRFWLSAAAAASTAQRQLRRERVMKGTRGNWSGIRRKSSALCLCFLC